MGVSILTRFHFSLPLPRATARKRIFHFCPPIACRSSMDQSSGLNLEDLKWDHSFVRELPGDPRRDSFPREVLHACYTQVSPSVQVHNPQLVAFSQPVADLLDLDHKEWVCPIPYISSNTYLSFLLFDFQISEARFSPFLLWCHTFSWSVSAHMSPPPFLFGILIHSINYEAIHTGCLMLSAMAGINLVCGLGSWVMAGQWL